KAGADAFIVTDLGMLSVLWKYNVALHASTQLGVSNVEGAKLLEQLGFCRVVLARETLENDIIKIKQQTNLEVEYFVHGALCVGYSGNCLLSSMMSGDSGNRGCCNQPCRLPYSTNLNMNASKFLLSTSDQCLIAKLDRLIAIGVDSFKIEGRLKQPHYVGEVVTQYRYALDNHKLRDNSIQVLKRAFNRGDFTEGYNYDSTDKIMSTNIQGQLGEKIGKVLGYKNQRLSMFVNSEVAKGSGIKIVFNNKELGGCALSDGFEQKGKQIIIKSQKNYPSDSDVYLTLDKNQVDRFADCAPKLAVDIKFVANVGKPMQLILSLCNQKLYSKKDSKNLSNKFCVEKNVGNDDIYLQVAVEGEVVEQSQNMPTTSEQMSKQLCKLNDTNFLANEVSIVCDDNCFIAVSIVNALRREATQMLVKKCLEKYDITKVGYNFDSLLNENNQHKNNDKNNKNIAFDKPFVVTSDLVNISDTVAKNCNIVLEIRDFGQENVKSILKNRLIENNIIQNLYFYFPRIVRGKDMPIVKSVFESFLPNLVGAVCDNLYAVFLSQNVEKNFVTIGGIGLNIYNNQYANIVKLDEYLPSIELNLQEIGELKTCKLAYGFGRIVVMNLTHCPLQLNVKSTCNNCKYKGDFCYRDKKEEYLMSRKKLANCYFDMYNPQVLDIRGKIKNFGYQFFINTYGFDKKQVEKIVNDYVLKQGESFEGSTNGHYFRGVK
ncbi:MAG: U32 family peptidase, partial [Clostridia bacterium]